MKIISPKLTALIMVRRDDLKRDAMALRDQAEKAFSQAEEQAKSLLQAAKTAVHQARIQANRMEREAELLQEAISEELELQVKAEQEIESQYHQKSIAQMRAEYIETNGKAS